MERQLYEGTEERDERSVREEEEGGEGSDTGCFKHCCVSLIVKDSHSQGLRHGAS